MASGEHGSAKVVAATDPGPGSQDGQNGQNGTAPGSAKPIQPTFGSGTPPAGSNTPANGNGSNTPVIVPDGSNGAGSTDTPPAGHDAGSAVTIERLTEIDVDSAPPNAKIFIDGADTGKITPATLSVPKKPGKKLQITLRLRGYNNFMFKAVDAGENSKQTTDLVPVKTRPGGPISVGPGSGGRTNGSGTKNNGSGGSQGSADPDALMHP
jgi:hypothetical protein